MGAVRAHMGWGPCTHGLGSEQIHKEDLIPANVEQRAQRNARTICKYQSKLISVSGRLGLAEPGL
jgi:hypothetical protein